MPIKDEIIGIAEIVDFLKRYEKQELALQNAIERDAHNTESVREIRNMALSRLEEAVNKYIDGRIKYVLEHMKRENDH